MPKEIKPNVTITPYPNSARMIALVVSEYNDNITGKLSKAAIQTLIASGVLDEDIHLVRVPGAWELLFGSQLMIQQPECRGVIALGAVIKGETTHDQHLNRAVSMGLMQLSLDHCKPIALGLLTVNSLEQAIQRSGGNAGNKGEEAANALIACLKLADSLRSPN
jgi:6,7-dimethyl-8-ribityllumazine synthase